MILTKLLSVCFVSEGQITKQLTVIIGQVATERMASLLFSDEQDNGQYYAVLRVVVIERLCVFNEVYVL
jgi:hypothetical protein